MFPQGLYYRINEGNERHLSYRGLDPDLEANFLQFLIIHSLVVTISAIIVQRCATTCLYHHMYSHSRDVHIDNDK
jgi:hypothetical protein